VSYLLNQNANPESKLQLQATIRVAPELAWNAVEVAGGDSGDTVTSVRFNGADGSYGNIGEIKLYRKC
jgi:hypothetical protein